MGFQMLGAANHIRSEAILFLIFGAFAMFLWLAFIFRSSLTSGKKIDFDLKDPFEVEYAKRYIDAERKINSSISFLRWVILACGVALLLVSAILFLISAFD
jgi:hypothetical protein